MNPVVPKCRPGRKLVALLRVGSGTKAGTRAQDAVLHPHGGAWQAARTRCPGWRWGALRRVAGGGRRSERGVAGWKKRVSRSRPGVVAERSGPKEGVWTSVGGMRDGSRLAFMRPGGRKEGEAERSDGGCFVGREGTTAAGGTRG